jgi:L-ribulose-5-phosphate 4-epimerase
LIDVPGIAELRRRLAVARGVLHNLGILDYAGHISARIEGEDRILITPQVTDLGSIGTVPAREIVEVNLKGEVLKGRFAPRETLLHVCIYSARPDVGGVVHGHPIVSTAFGLAERDLVPVSVRGFDIAALGVKLFRRSDSIDSMDLGGAVADTLGDSRACLLQGHGSVVVGRTFEEACLGAINLEQAAKIQIMATLLGQPKLMSPKDIGARAARLSNMARIQKVWRYYEKMYASGST